MGKRNFRGNDLLIIASAIMIVLGVATRTWVLAFGGLFLWVITTENKHFELYHNTQMKQSEGERNGQTA